MLSNFRKCSVCGQEMPTSASKCSNCGAVADVKRNSFVSFWLWFCAIINGLCVIGYFSLLFSSKGLWTGTPEPTWLRLMWLVGSAVILCGYIMLIKWNKKGFYLLSGMCGVNMIINLIVNGISLSVLSPVISIAILYAILQIKKDGIEYWEAMGNKAVKNCMCIKKTFILLIILLCTPMLTLAQTKRALVIGIGKQIDSAWNKINGDKDVPYVLEILNAAKYEQIITCVNDEATKTGIVSAFQTLTQSCQPNDIVYIHYSGHGQQMRDIGNDEADDLDECWIPYDACRKPSDTYKGEKHLVDDEVNMLLSNIRNKIGVGGKMLVVVDACHGGDATRGQGETVRGVEDIFETVKFWLGFSTNEQNANIQANAERWITLSACESNQVNIEMKSPAVGKLTYAIYSKVKNREFGNNEEFFKRLRMFVNMNTGSRPQRPTMTGETAKYNITDILR